MFQVEYSKKHKQWRVYLSLTNSECITYYYNTEIEANQAAAEMNKE